MVWGPFLSNGRGLDGMGPQIQVLEGNFNVILGPLDADPTPRALLDAFEGKDRYLEIAFINPADPTGTALLPPIEPRQQILAAPYALKAKDADSVGGVLRADINGNIGVGTSTPGQPLEVADAEPVIRLRDDDSGTTASTMLVDFHDTDGQLGYVGYGNDTSNDLALYQDRTDGALHLQNSGNVFSLQPGGVLDWNVNQDKYARFGRASIGSVGHVDYAAFSHLDRRDTGGYALLQSAGGTTYLNAASGQSLRFRVNNVDQMVMLSDGKFGIGTTGPAQKLHVNGNAYVSGYLGVGTSSPSAALHVVGSFDGSPNANGVHLGATGGHYGMELVGYGKTPYIDFKNDTGSGDYDMRIILTGNDYLALHGGNVGIRTSSPYSPLEIKQSTYWYGGGLMLRHYSNNNFWAIYSGISGSYDFDLRLYPNIGPSVAYLDYYTCTWYYTSDKRLKKDIEPLTGTLAKVLKLRPVSYAYAIDKAKNPIDNGRRVIGFIADEVQEIMPELVREKFIETLEPESSQDESAEGELRDVDGEAPEAAPKEPEGEYYKAISLTDYGVLAIGAIQDLHGELQAERQRTADLEARIEQLEALVNNLTQNQ